MRQHHVPDDSYQAQDGLYDLSWSEIHENQIVTASGDGSLLLWDIMLNVRRRFAVPVIIPCFFFFS